MIFNTTHMTAQVGVELSASRARQPRANQTPAAREGDPDSGVEKVHQQRIFLTRRPFLLLARKEKP